MKLVKNCVHLTHRGVAALNQVQVSYLKEPCIQVDENDEPIAMISKEDCHRSPILHRAFSVFIFNKQHKMLLQKRSSTKITFPDVWTNACCSHPHYADTEMGAGAADNWLGIRRAAARKLDHELGVGYVDVGRMHVMGRFIYSARSDDEWCEHELDYAIVLTDFDEAALRPNSDEVSEVRCVTRDELARMMDAGAASGSVAPFWSTHSNVMRFSPWFQLFTKFNWLDSWWSNLNNLNSLKDMSKIHKLN